MLRTIKRFILQVRIRYYRKKSLYCCDKESRSVTDFNEAEYWRILKIDALNRECELTFKLMKA